MRYLLILCCLWSGMTYASSDTTYYDAWWRKCDKIQSSYYRTAEKRKDLYYVEDHFLSGQLQMQGTFSSLEPPVKNGFFTYYREKGGKISDGEYYNNMKRGTFRQYDESGRVKLSEEFKNDLLHGKVITYMPDGKKKTALFENGRFVSTDWTLSEGVQALGSMLPGLVAGAPDTVAKSIDASIKNAYRVLPDSTRRLSATVNVSFTVDSTGQPSRLKISNSENDVLDQLVVNAIKASGTWRPRGDRSLTRQVDVSVKFPEVLIRTNISVTKLVGDSTILGLSNSIHHLDSLLKPLKAQRPDTLAAYFRQLYQAAGIPDEKGTIKMTFTADRNGHPKDIELISGDSKKLRNFVTKGIRDYKGWARSMMASKPTITYYTLIVTFPAVVVLSFGHTLDE